MINHWFIGKWYNVPIKSIKNLIIPQCNVTIMYYLPITSVILSVLMRAFPMIPALVHEMSPLLERGYVWERWVYRPNSRRSSVKKKPMVRDEIYYERSDKKTFLIDMAMIAVNVSSKLHFTAVFLPFFSLLYNFPLALRMFEVQSILNFSAPSLSLKIWMTSLAR